MLGLRRKASKPKTGLPERIFIKTGDTVLVISGKNEGETGIVRHVFRNRGRILIEGINKIKKAIKPNPMAGKTGGIVEMEAPLNVSKVMLYCLKCSKPTRIKMTTLSNGKKSRQCRKCNANFDE